MPVVPVELVAYDEPNDWGEGTRVIKYIRPLAAIADAKPYQEEYKGLLVIEEGPCEEDTGTLEVISQITLRYTHVIRRAL